MTSLGTRSSGPSRPSQGHPRTHLPRVTVLTTHLLRVTVLTTLPGRVSGLRRRGETRQRLPEPPAWRVPGLGVAVPSLAQSRPTHFRWGPKPAWLRPLGSLRVRKGPWQLREREPGCRPPERRR